MLLGDKRNGPTLGKPGSKNTDHFKHWFSIELQPYNFLPWLCLESQVICLFDRNKKVSGQSLMQQQILNDPFKMLWCAQWGEYACCSLKVISCSCNHESISSVSLKRWQRWAVACLSWQSAGGLVTPWTGCSSVTEINKHFTHVHAQTVEHLELASQ